MPIVVALRPHHHPDVLPIGDELAGDVRTEVAVGADDECGRGHRAPTCRIQASASSGSVPSALAFLHHFIAAETNRSGL